MTIMHLNIPRANLRLKSLWCWTHIEGAFALEGRVWIRVGHTHLHEASSMHHRSDLATVLVPDIVQDEPLAIVEAVADVPVLPLDGVPLHLMAPRF